MFGKNSKETTLKNLSKEDVRSLFIAYSGAYSGIPRCDHLVKLLNTTSDDPIVEAVAAAWKEHEEYQELKERLRRIMLLVNPPQLDKYAPRLNEFKDVTDEELAKCIEKYETELVKARDVKALRELSAIVCDIHGNED